MEGNEVRLQVELLLALNRKRDVCSFEEEEKKQTTTTAKEGGQANNKEVLPDIQRLRLGCHGQGWG